MMRWYTKTTGKKTKIIRQPEKEAIAVFYRSRTIHNEAGGKKLSFV